MRNFNRDDRSFVQYSKINVVNNSLPENAYEKFSIGLFRTDEQKQFCIVFYTFCGIPSMKLEAECNSLDFLYECQDVLKELSKIDMDTFKPEDLYRILLNLGIKDTSENVNKLYITT